MAVAHYQDEVDGGIFSPTKNGNEAVLSTPAFPLSPETSYGKEMSVCLLFIYFNSTINILAVTEEELYFFFSPSENTSTIPPAHSLQPKGQQPVWAVQNQSW